MSVLEILSGVFTNYKTQTDEWLIERVGTDRQAYNELYNRYHNHIIRFVFRKFKNLDISEDVAQHCFLEMLAYPDKFKGKKIKQYFFSMAVNYVIDEYKQSMVNTFSLEEEREKGFDVAVDEENLDKVIFREFKTFLDQIIKELNSDYEMVATLFYVEDMKPGEIAEILKVPVKKITNVIHICRQYFHKRLKEKYGKGGQSNERR